MQCKTQQAAAAVGPFAGRGREFRYTFEPEACRYLEAYRRILDTMIRRMTNVGLTDNIMQNFILQILPGHRAAIELSGLLLGSITSIASITCTTSMTDSGEGNLLLRELALELAAERNREIGRLYRLECECPAGADGREKLSVYQNGVNRILHTMFRQMKGVCAGKRIEENYIGEMLPLLEGTGELARWTLASRTCPEPVPVREGMIASCAGQYERLQELMEWRNG